MAGCPVKGADDSLPLLNEISCQLEGSKSDGCSSESFNPLNNTYVNDAKVSMDNDAKEPLPNNRQMSSIPRNETGQLWIYPSQQQFYNAMKRKNFSPQLDDMAVVVPIHNIVNEMAWKKILEWESLYQSNCGRGPILRKFTGKAEEKTLKSRLKYFFFGGAEPFDRHDWVVDRCGIETTYIIDFYKGKRDQQSSISLFIDLRPKIDSFRTLYERVYGWVKGLEV
jgi:cytochrome c heme-lyase